MVKIIIADLRTDAAASQAHEIVCRLEEEIVLGQRSPRERLIEDELMAHFDAKRHVVREALIDLDRLGLVQRVPNRGAQVRSFSRREIEDIYAVRTLLECEAAALLPNPAPLPLLATLRAIQATHDLAAEKADLRRTFRANQAFHSALFAACGNTALAEAIEEHARRVHGVRFYALSNPRRLEKARREHWAMIEALEYGDRTCLVQLCRDHLPPSREAYILAHPQIL